MNIPETVKIGYKDYKVEKIERLIDNSTVLYGQVLYDPEIIQLSSTYNENLQKCTLIHEIVHAVDEMNGIELTEEQVVKLGKGLYQVIKDNPGMFKE